MFSYFFTSRTSDHAPNLSTHCSKYSKFRRFWPKFAKFRPKLHIVDNIWYFWADSQQITQPMMKYCQSGTVRDALVPRNQVKVCRWPVLAILQPARPSITPLIYLQIISNNNDFDPDLPRFDSNYKIEKS